MHKFLLLCLCLFIMSGCSNTTYNSVSLMDTQPITLPKNSVALIVQPEPATFEGRIYPKSSITTAQIIKNLLVPVTSKTALTPSQFGITEGTVDLPGIEYIFNPIITEWEQRAAGWSGKPARVSLVLEIYDNKSKPPKLIAKGNLAAVGSNYHSQHIQEILTPLLHEYLNKLYGGALPPLPEPKKTDDNYERAYTNRHYGGTQTMSP